MFEAADKTDQFLPPLFTIMTCRTFGKQFSDYKSAKLNERKYSKIIVDQNAVQDVKTLLKKSPLKERILKKLVHGKIYTGSKWVMK